MIGGIKSTFTFLAILACSTNRRSRCDGTFLVCKISFLFSTSDDIAFVGSGSGRDDDADAAAVDVDVVAAAAVPRFLCFFFDGLGGG